MTTMKDDSRRRNDMTLAGRSRTRSVHARSLQFGELTLDLEHRAAIRGGRVRYVRDDYWKALMLLIEKEGKVVEKVELQEALGCSTDGSFTKHIQRIREILGDSKKPYQLIEVEHSVGYRWIGGQDTAGQMHANVYRHPNGRFERQGGIWKEYRNDVPEHPFIFKELRRDDEYIYLFDDSRRLDAGRPMYFRIPVTGGVAQWTFPNPLRWEDVMIVEPQWKGRPRAHVPPVHI